MRRILTLIFIPILTIALIYGLIHFFGVLGFTFAWVLNFMLMTFVLAFTETLKSPLNSHYFSSRKWEQNGQVYEMLGINIFRKILVWVGWEKLNKKSNPVEKNINAVKNLHYRTKQSELGHSIIFIIVLGFNIYVALEYGILKSLWLLVLNVLLNLYPIFLQRFNRPRLERVLRLSRQE